MEHRKCTHTTHIPIQNKITRLKALNSLGSSQLNTYVSKCTQKDLKNFNAVKSNRLNFGKFMEFVKPESKRSTVNYQNGNGIYMF